jgi:AhpD family alkylhydroperoxidase
MSNRVIIADTEPAAYKAMYALENYLQATTLTKSQKELIKIRSSQINGCAYCIDMHTKDALKNGETPQRVFLLSAWREANLFTEEERAILQITEEVTLIQQHGLSEETYLKAKLFFSETQLAQIIMAIVTINAWNRIAISTRLEIAA